MPGVRSSSRRRSPCWASDQGIALLSQEKDSTDNLLSPTLDPIREDPRFQALQHRNPDQGVEP
jgi:hypothetical protein